MSNNIELSINSLVSNLFFDIVRGLLLAIIYFEITDANDTTIANIGIFIFFYVILHNAAKLAGLNTDMVTAAFMTKAVFTLVDERIKRKDDSKKQKGN